MSLALGSYFALPDPFDVRFGAIIQSLEQLEVDLIRADRAVEAGSVRTLISDLEWQKEQLSVGPA